MKVIVCLDNRGGMLFNRRRQSRDRVLCERLAAMCAGDMLWMHPFSADLYGNLSGVDIRISEDFLCEAPTGAYCLVEAHALALNKEQIEELIIFRWNRDYPADLYFDLSLDDWRLTEQTDFSGYSHERLTEEHYQMT